MNKEEFIKAAPILHHIQSHGFEAYYIGGSVRDYLMDRPIHDIDITTSASPDEIESIFEHTIPIGKEHGTINVVYNHENYEITTYRAEGEYKDHRRPSEVFFVRDLFRDVERRDFTINAIAMNTNFEIRDYFDGYSDIQNKLIRTVGNAEERFDEDALRILRGLRFKSQLNFKIDTNTYQAMQHKISDTKFLSIERIIVEFKKLLEGKAVHSVFSLLKELNFFKYVPFFKQFDFSSIEIIEPVNLELFIAIIQYQQTHVQAKLSDLKISNDSKRTIKNYLNIFELLSTIKSKKELKLLVYDYGKDVLSYILSMKETLIKNGISLSSPIIFNQKTVEEVYQQLPIHQRSEMMINGKIILEQTNQKGGPWLKTILRQIECAIINQELPNNQSEILKWVKTNVEI